jgi:hypothetical protein
MADKEVERRDVTSDEECELQKMMPDETVDKPIASRLFILVFLFQLPNQRVL